MKKKIILFTAAALTMVFAACQKFEKGPGGLEYKIIKDAGNAKGVAEDFFAIDMIVKTDRDSILSSTYDIGLPQIVQVAPDSVPGSYEGDYNTIFKMLGEGDSATFKLNLDTMEEKTGQPKPEFADQHIVFTVKVNKHFQKGELNDSTLFSHIDKYFEGLLDDLKNSEQKKLDSYVSKNKLEPKKTDSGLQYVIKEEGSGETANEGDTVLVNYVGSLINGVMFDTNIEEKAKKENKLIPGREYEPLKVHLGQTPVIQGWTEGMKLMKKGGKATFLIPSNLGYGEQGGGREIPPYAPLVFEVEVIDIIPTVPAAEEEENSDENDE